MANSYGIISHMKPEMRKITINLPAALIDGLAEREGRPLTEIMREALKAYRHARACDALRSLRGKGGLSMSYEELKELRD